MNIKAIIVLSSVFFVSGCTLKTSDDLYTDGVKSVREGKLNGAIELLKNALKKNHNHLEARYELAKVYVLVGKYDQAEKEFQKVKMMSSCWIKPL